MLARIRKAQDNNEGGFTLIELLVVIIIIGILAAIAIPTFLNQRQKGYKADMKSTVKNGATAIESYATETGGLYTSVTTGAMANEGWKLPSTQTATLQVSADKYCLSVIDSRLPDTVHFVYTSTAGKPVERNSACAAADVA